MRINIHCEDCEADYDISHDLDETKYEVITCPFCGSADLEQEEVYVEVDD